MEEVLGILFYLSGFIIIWAMIGYKLSLKIIHRLFKFIKVKKNYSHIPTVTVMVVAHNEEKVILEKLQNLINIDYPADKIQFIIASDHSTDETNQIVRSFISTQPAQQIRLFEVKNRKGKTNAQNEAQKTVITEFLVMTDANSMLDRKAVRELMAAFTSEDISYVTGRVTFINESVSAISGAETIYWDSDLLTREIESQMQTITAGNGALYACRNSEYEDFDLIQSHDTAMPLHFALKQKRAIANHDAIAYEKAGENVEDEFGRKVRMNRLILKHILPDFRILNIFKYKWFTYFYFGHRTCRYLLWLAHFILYVTSALLAGQTWFYMLVFAGQTLFYLIALFTAISKYKNKYFTMVYYYSITIVAQWVGVYKIITGQTKPFWEKAESTR
ncbi:glycosyltransferase [Paenibacillus sp. MMS20-IR301]|uniref:glycosyltransferase n=1 Tax=Paenibacillus sp. MMS20-IR301 TaxID=2895946 RepID=UPI0028ECB6F1|nr:glycosyltransferase [Paenibacillus sp. MMS20-IR301]WNS43527.1 glycosyltransferase [Paenibacillus sp. MMS20-IR301]